MVKRLTTIRLAALTDAQLGDLQTATGLTQSELIALAVDRLHRDLISQPHEDTEHPSTPRLAD